MINSFCEEKKLRKRLGVNVDPTGRDESTHVSSEISLYKNGVKIPESYQDTYYSGKSSK